MIADVSWKFDNELWRISRVSCGCNGEKHRTQQCNRLANTTASPDDVKRCVIVVTERSVSVGCCSSKTTVKLVSHVVRRLSFHQNNMYHTHVTACLVITGCTVHGSAGTVLTAIALSYGKWRNSTPRRIKTPSPVEMKLWTYDYVREICPLIYFFVKIRAAGASGESGEI